MAAAAVKKINMINIAWYDDEVDKAEKVFMQKYNNTFRSFSIETGISSQNWLRTVLMFTLAIFCGLWRTEKRWRIWQLDLYKHDTWNWGPGPVGITYLSRGEEAMEKLFHFQHMHTHMSLVV
jgi:hypothetical protein